MGRPVRVLLSPSVRMPDPGKLVQYGAMKESVLAVAPDGGLISYHHLKGLTHTLQHPRLESALIEDSEGAVL